AMGAMRLDEVEPEPRRAPRRRDERRLDAVETRGSEGMRHGPTVVQGDRRWCRGEPGPVLPTERATAFPGALCRALAPGMRQLDAEPGIAEAAAGRDNATERRLIGVAIQSETSMRDAPCLLDRRRLDHQEPRARHGKRAQMLHMPVIGAAVIGAVLAHR